VITVVTPAVDGPSIGNKSFCFFLQKEALASLLRAAAPPTPRASGSFLKKRTKKLSH
jgi:hypothetical protein